MYIQQTPESILFYMLYAAVAMMSLMACCYLLFRRGNAFAPDITSPVRLRRWTAGLMAIITLGHLWYMPAYFQSSYEGVKTCIYVGAMLDFMFIFPLPFIVMFEMLQDHRHPLWPPFAAMMPPVVGVAWCLVSHSDALIPMIFGYIALAGIILILYMVHELRRYGRWLRDNYADLEHKEVWQSLMVMGCVFFILGFYVFGVGGSAYEYIMQFFDIGLISYLLWRVETLSDLSVSHSTVQKAEAPTLEAANDSGLPTVNFDNMEALLQQHCINEQLYLQHDLTVSELAKVIGTNRYYLSQYFSRQGLTYNAYINGLRINHFISHYHETIESDQSYTALELAQASGYRSYSTFSLAFKQRMGQSVTAWMREQAS